MEQGSSHLWERRKAHYLSLVVRHIFVFIISLHHHYLFLSFLFSSLFTSFFSFVPFTFYFLFNPLFYVFTHIHSLIHSQALYLIPIIQHSYPHRHPSPLNHILIPRNNNPSSATLSILALHKHHRRSHNAVLVLIPAPYTSPLSVTQSARVWLVILDHPCLCYKSSS
ncbi:hypothetical protein F5H01DRAFT_17863 [Linnemannia elongata]|nr:hypothetical protein F5H01DRAFT_17863 [Linnemannia elongata]